MYVGICIPCNLNFAPQIAVMSATLSFSSFFEDWLIRLEALLRRLESLLSTIDGFDRNGDCSELIMQVLSHYQEFYREKARIAAEDVFLLISQPWLSSFEMSLMWVSGFRPSILFRIVDSSVTGELSAEQKRRMKEIQDETRRKEREIAQEMARVQETVAEQPVYGRMKVLGKLVDGERTELEAAVEEMTAAMVAAVGNADALQGWSAAELLEVLSPAQAVKALAAAARLQLRVREWGVDHDCRRDEPSGL